MPSFASSISVSGAAAPNSPPSSAAVLEFVCLFTHDLRRKQKRWQDGRLKYHTFNKRVMVYDERGNFIGDMHWRHDHEFGEGEEFELERGSAIVQVAECVGRKEQDLSELLDKRVKEKEQRQLNLAARSNGSLSARPTPRPIQQQQQPQADHFQLRHRPLHQLIGTPTGHHGRALAPTESPYEQRHSPNNASEEQSSASRPSKRRKYDDVPSKSGYAQALFGATLTLSATPMSSAPSRPRPTRARSPSIEAENRTSSQEQEVLREQPKSSRHFNQQGLKKARHGPLTVKQADPMPHKRLTGASEQVPAVRGHHDERIEKPVNRPYDRRQPEVITLEDDDDVNDGLQADTPRLSPQPPNIPTRQTTEKTASEKHKSSRKRAEAEASREEPDNEPPKSGPPRQRTKPKPVDQDLLPKRTKSSTSKSASHQTLLNDDGPSQHAPKALEKPEEARTELRIKSQKKRGLLMMSDSVRAAPRKSVKPCPPERNAISNPSASNGAPIEDDPFASSPPRVEQQQTHGNDPQKQIASLIVDSAMGTETSDIQIDVDDDDQGNDMSLSPVRVEATTSKRLKSRRRIIVDEDDEDADMTGKSLRKRRGRSATVDGDTVSIDMEDQDVEPPKKRSRKPKKSRELEDTDILETDSKDTATSRRNPRRAAAQRRQRAREDTPIDADNSDFGATDEVQEPQKKKQRGDELPQVPAGPRLARLSKKGVKSREVIGLRLDDAAMFRGFAAPTKPPVQQPKPHQEPKLPVPIITNSTLIEVPEENNPSKGDAASKLGQTGPDTGRSAQISKLRKEQTSSENHVLGKSDLPAAPEERVKPAGRQEAKEESKGAASPTSDTVTNQPTVKPAPSSPVATTREPAKVAEPVEADLLEGFSLSPVVFSPVKPSLSTTLAPPELSSRDTSVPDAEEASPITERPVQPRPTEQLAPCPAPPERRSVNGLGRTNSDVGTLQARGQTTDTKAPEPPKDTTTKAPTVARIVNPATRGRKAALKSHAAGQVPQSVLPPNNPGLNQQPVVIYIERPAPEAESPKPKQVKKMSFPGFAPARQSGPWSREAFDLLEKGRPI